MSDLPTSSLSPLYVCGPPASGKNSLAITLAGQHGGEVVNADLFQAYRGVQVLSSAPSVWHQEQVSHHLFGVLDPKVDTDPAAFRTLVLPVIEEIQSRGKLPIVTGGSGVYLKTLTHGVSPIPPSDPELRAKLAGRPDEELIAELTELDAAGATATDLKNRRYLVRALEVCLLSGRKMSELKAEWSEKSAVIDANLRGYYLLWDNENAKQRISSRTMQILEKGGIDEVKALRESASETLRGIVGFREIVEHLEGKISLKECHKGFHTSTRRVHKGQRAWMKKEKWISDLSCPIADPEKVKLP